MLIIVITKGWIVQNCKSSDPLIHNILEFCPVCSELTRTKSTFKALLLDGRSHLLSLLQECCWHRQVSCSLNKVLNSSGNWLKKALKVLLGTTQYLPLYHLQKKLMNNKKNAENSPGAIAVATPGTQMNGLTQGIMLPDFC